MRIINILAQKQQTTSCYLYTNTSKARMHTSLLFTVDLGGNIRCQHDLNAHNSGFKLAASTLVLSIIYFYFF